jgi:hypothetical protein
MSGSVVVDNKKKRAAAAGTGLIILTSSVTLIEPAEDDKITIIVDGPIGTMNCVTCETTFGGPEGMVMRVGDSVVIKQSGGGGGGKKGKKGKGQIGVMKSVGGSVNMFL